MKPRRRGMGEPDEPVIDLSEIKLDITCGSECGKIFFLSCLGLFFFHLAP